jgi:hypothetical protein
MESMESSDQSSHPVPIPKPIWKSVGFWLGLVISMFLAWIFVQSISFETTFGHIAPTEVWAVGLNEASFQIRHVDTSKVGHGLKSGWQLRRTRSTTRDLEQDSLPLAGTWKFFAFEEQWGWEFRTYVSIPLWFISVVWLLIWMGTVRWWRHRVRNRLTNLIEVNSEP